MYEQFYEESSHLKDQIQMKENALDALLNSKNPDIERLRNLHNEIRDLRMKLTEDRRYYELEAQ